MTLDTIRLGGGKVCFDNTNLRKTISLWYRLSGTAAGVSLLLLLLVLGSVCPALATPEPVILSLSRALSLTLQQNRLIKYYQLDRDIASEYVNYERAIYMPYLSITGATDRSGWNTATVSNYQLRQTDSYQTEISRLHESGGTSALGFGVGEDDLTFFSTRSGYSEYTSEVYLRYDQPLLKDRGADVNNVEINKAEIDVKTATQKYEDMRNTILFNVMRDYFALYRAQQELRIMSEIRSNTLEIRDMIEAKVEMRKLPITDLNKIEATIYIQDEQLVNLENRTMQAQRQLLLSIFSDVMADTISAVTLITTPDEIIDDYCCPLMPEMMTKAETMDIEMIGYLNEREKLQHELRVARNDALPDLNISTEVGYNGYDYEGYSSAVDDIGDNYQVAGMLTLGLPLRNTQAESKRAEIEARLQQVDIQVLNRREEIRNSVQQLFSDYDTVQRRTGLAGQVAALAKENLANELERLVGEKSTVLNTLDYQTDLNNAEQALLSAKIDHVIIASTILLYQREMESFLE